MLQQGNIVFHRIEALNITARELCRSGQRSLAYHDKEALYIKEREHCMCQSNGALYVTAR